MRERPRGERNGNGAVWQKVDAGVALMDVEVDWPNVPDGGFVHGRDEVRRHWIEQFAKADPRVEIDAVSAKGNGRVEARVRQTVRGPDGRDLPQQRATHVFTLAGERIERMEVRG